MVSFGIHFTIYNNTVNAKRRVRDLMYPSMSFMLSRKRIGPRAEPCGKPDVTYIMSDRATLTETLFAVIWTLGSH